ncbi:MAG: TetR/AcrR family transcriptional regulator [Candidatus Krumholzibacteriia bacterium]
MARANTRTRILDTAERLFAEQGYAATSLRQVCGKARVNLGSIHYYFKSKQELFRAVLSRRVRPLDTKRLELLEQLESDGNLTLESVIEAFIGPGGALMLKDEGGAAWPKFVARSRLEPGLHWDVERERHEAMLRRFFNTLRKLLPELPARELAYRFYFLLGTASNTLIDTRSVDLPGGRIKSFEEDPKGVQRRLIAFVAAGMRAPLKSRSRRSST